MQTDLLTLIHLVECNCRRLEIVLRNQQGAIHSSTAIASRLNGEFGFLFDGLPSTIEAFGVCERYPKLVCDTSIDGWASPTLDGTRTVNKSDLLISDGPQQASRIEY